jgi:hypothetical protein
VKTLASKALAFGVSLIMAALTMNLAFADGMQKFKIHIAGGFVQNILQAQVNQMGQPTGVVENRNIFLGKGVGRFGRVDVMGVGFSGPPVSDKLCADGLIKVADIVENNLVLTFNDLSLLYGDGTGVVCFNPLDPTAPPTAEIDGTWDGGTGRFSNAGGTWSTQFHFFEPVGVATQFVAEAGVIEGYLTRSRDND